MDSRTLTTFFTQFNSQLYGATKKKILSNIVKSSEEYHLQSPDTVRLLSRYIF